VHCLVQHDHLNFTVPGLSVNNECVPFDHRSSSISAIVQSSLSNETFERWNMCCDEAHNCCEQMIENYRGENFFNTCESHWDGLNCFHESFPGTIVDKECPYRLKRIDESSCKCELFYIIGDSFFLVILESGEQKNSDE
jgi:hypothetical protein